MRLAQVPGASRTLAGRPQAQRAGLRPLPLRSCGPLSPQRPWTHVRPQQHVAKAGNQFDSFYLSPSELLSSQMRAMDEVDRMMSDIDRSVDKVMRQAEADMLRTQRDLAQQREAIISGGPSVRIYSEQGSTSSMTYSMTQSVYYYGPHGLAPTPAPSMFSPVLLVAAILAGVYAAVTAAFFKNFDLTVYRNQGRWVLAPLWPVLLFLNKSFRSQFLSAIQGYKPKLDDLSSSK